MFGHYIHTQVSKREFQPSPEDNDNEYRAFDSSSLPQNDDDEDYYNRYQLLQVEDDGGGGGSSDEEEEVGEIETTFKRSSLIGQSTFYA